jgi:hypothetical protein
MVERARPAVNEQGARKRLQGGPARQTAVLSVLQDTDAR